MSPPDRADSPPPARRHRLPARARLRRRREFAAVYADGRKIHGTFVVWFVRFGAPGGPRVGITTSRRVGTAVRRNAVRRKIREWVRLHYDELPPDVELVIVARPSAAAAASAALHADLDRCMTRLPRSRE